MQPLHRKQFKWKYFEKKKSGTFKQSKQVIIYDYSPNAYNSLNAKRADTPSRLSDPKLKKEDSSSNLSKNRSPSTNLLPTKNRNSTIGRYKDIYIEDENMSGTFGQNPFSGIKNINEKDKANNSQNQNSCRIHSSHSSNRRKTESVQINSSSLSKNRK